ncbi:MAG TPA: T9SS type A sorting domain-containing protein [Fluviicola sp.]|nr:T9SS type A sorting domain-containing protein [Fluviicola sp.]
MAKKPNGQLRNQYKEDIGHGAFDIMFPILYNKYYSTFYPYVTGGKYFEDYQMVRFRNTLTKSIYNPNHFSTCTSLQPTFNCNVTGTCTGHYYGDNVSSPAPNEYMNYQSNAKNWTGLYVFDNVAGAAPGSSVYSILMNYYINVESCLPITQNNYSGVSIVGLADLVVANYEKEGIGCSNVPQPPSGPSSIVVSPNPVRDVISIASELEIIHVDVITFAGQVVQSDKNTSKINVSALEEGVYLLKVTLENQEIISEKIFIK